MTADELVEKVARNIERAVQMQDFGRRADDGGWVCTAAQAKRLSDCCNDAAQDAVALVLEEAAKAQAGFLSVGVMEGLMWSASRHSPPPPSEP